MIIVYYIGGDLRILFTEIRRTLIFRYSKVRKRLTKKIIASYPRKYEKLPLPNRYLGRNLTEETVRSVERGKVGYLYSL